MINPTEASIIIVTKNQKCFLERSIPILKKQKNINNFEIIVVDSGSTDGAVEYCEKEKIKVVKISPNNFNYARSFNKGAYCARGKYLVRLSGDCIPQNSLWLWEMIKPFKDSMVGGTYGKYIISGRKGYVYPDYWPSKRFSNKLTRYSIKPFIFFGVNIFGLSNNIYNFAGGTCAIRKSIWEKRPFNESLPAGEDAEYSWFLHLIGYDIVYNPEAEVLHEHKKDTIKTLKNYLGLNKWSMVLMNNILGYWIKRIGGNDPYKDFIFRKYPTN